MTRQLLTATVTALVCVAAVPAVADDPQGQRAATTAAAPPWCLAVESRGPQAGYQQMLVADRPFGDVDIEAELRRSDAMGHFGLVFRFRDPDNLYRFVIRSSQSDFRLEKVLAGKSDYAQARYVPYPTEQGRSYRVRLSLRGDKVTVFVDDRQLLEESGFAALATGLVGVTAYDPTGAEFRAFRVSAPDGQVLYADTFDTGKLEGWVNQSGPGLAGTWVVRRQAEMRVPAYDFGQHRLIRFLPDEPPLARLREFGNAVRRRDGEWLAIWIEENQHGTPPWAAMPRSGRLMSARSADEGLTWHEHRVFLDTPVDDRHAYLTQLADGTLLCAGSLQFFAFGAHAAPTWCMRSADGGRTWDDPNLIRMPEPMCPPDLQHHTDPQGLFFTQPALELADGSLVLPVFTWMASGKGTRCFLLRSRDQGRSWGDASPVADDPAGRNNYCEPSVAVTPAGTWVCVMRDEIYNVPGDPFGGYTLAPTHICTSADGGHTWSSPEPMATGFPGPGSGAPCVITTTRGVLVFASNTGIAFSWDSGATWIPQVLQLGYYPVLTALPDGRALSLGAGLQCQAFLPNPAPAPGNRTAPAVEQPSVTTPDIPTVVRPVASPRLGSATPPGGPFRVLRRPGPTAFGGEQIVAVYRTTRDQVEAAWSDDDGASWDGPATVAEGPASGTPQLGELPGGELLCIVPWADAAAPGSGLAWALSADGGRSWSAPRPISAGAAPLQCSAAPVAVSRELWVVPTWTGAGATASLQLLETPDRGATWDVKPAGITGFVEPALLVLRSGERRLFAREATDKGIVMFSAAADSPSWSGPEALGIEGPEPAAMELVRDMLVVGVRDERGTARAAYTWPGLGAWVSTRFACAYAVPIGGTQHLGYGTGLGLNGVVSAMAQLPLAAEQRAAWLASTPRFIHHREAVFTFDGPWTEVADERASGGSYRSGTKGATCKVKFSGTAVGLVFSARPKHGLVQVTVDGEEYPPVETAGPEAFRQRCCVATDLAPGEHELAMRILLPWRDDELRLEGIEVMEH
jgi:hypothetical protein